MWFKVAIKHLSRVASTLDGLEQHSILWVAPALEMLHALDMTRKETSFFCMTNHIIIL